MNPRLASWFRSSGISTFFAFLLAVVAGCDHPKPWLFWPGLGGFALSVVLWFRERVQASRRASGRTAFFATLRDPDPEADAFRNRHGLDKSVVGRVIEIWAHHSLESMRPIEELGIEPSVVKFLAPTPGEFTNVLAECGGLVEFPGENRWKYGIKSLPIGVMDDESFVIGFSRTDYRTWRSVRERIEKDPNLRWKWSSPYPARNLLPQSMSLQFLVRFIESGEVLAMSRMPGLASEPGKWSLSGEEQLYENDFQSTSVTTAEHLFRRAFIEEVFGSRIEDQQLLDRVWREDCAKLVYSHRIWSFFLEENTGIFQTFGVYNLFGTPAKLREIHETAVSAGWGHRDDEGTWYTVTTSEIDKLLTAGSCSASRLHGDPESTVINCNNLHQTSRYRLWRLYVAQKREPETLTSLHLQ
jgi:hypothetical protein